MKPISLDLIITGLRAKKDGSLGLTCETPELDAEFKVAMFSLQNVNLKALFQPEQSSEAPLEVKTEIDQKTPSQRLRNTLFILWKNEGEKGDFDSFYKLNMEKIIDFVKRKLD